MEPKYVEAIKAGVIGGVILAVLAMISQLAALLGFINADELTSGAMAVAGISAAFGCCICMAYVVVLGGTGALAVRMTSGLLKDLNDALITSAVAGAVAGIIWGVASIVIDMLGELINPDIAGVAGKVAGSMFSGVCGLVCCLPAAAVIGIVIAAIGGAIYWAVVLKR